MRPRGVEQLSISGRPAAAACRKDVRVGIEGRPGKRRGPWAVWLLAVVTCGVYGLVWYYKANRELRDSGAGAGGRPVLAVLALLPGVVLLYVPLFTSVYRTGARIRRVQAHAGLEPSCWPGLGLVLVFALGSFPVYYQAQLNKAWIATAAAADGGPDELERATGEDVPEEAVPAEPETDRAGSEETPVEPETDRVGPEEAGRVEPETDQAGPEEATPGEPEPDEAAAAQGAEPVG